MKGRLKNQLMFRALKLNPNAKYNELSSYKLVIARVRAKSMARMDSVGTVERQSNLSFIKLDLNKMIKYLKQGRIKMSCSMFKFFSKRKMNYNSLRKNNNSDSKNTNFPEVITKKGKLNVNENKSYAVKKLKISENNHGDNKLGIGRCTLVIGRSTLVIRHSDLHKKLVISGNTRRNKMGIIYILRRYLLVISGICRQHNLVI
jgi:hypothetical protein